MATDTSALPVQQLLCRAVVVAAGTLGSTYLLLRNRATLPNLSAQLGQSSDTLQAQHHEWGLGYGEIAMAYGFARASRAGPRGCGCSAMAR